MSGVCKFFILISLLASTMVAAAEKVISTISEVELVQVDKVDLHGNLIAVDLLAKNHNMMAVELSIKLTSSGNIKNGLIDEVFAVQPNSSGYFGWLRQDNKEQDATWHVEWYVNKISEPVKSSP